MTLKSRLTLRFAIGIPVFCALLFIPAGSFRFWQGWAYLNGLGCPNAIRFCLFL